MAILIPEKLGNLQLMRVARMESRRLGGGGSAGRLPTLRPRNAVGTAFHRRPSPQAAFGNTIAFVTFDELAKSWRKQMTVGEPNRLVGEIRQQKASCC